MSANTKWIVRRIFIGLPLMFSLFVIFIVGVEWAASVIPYGEVLGCLLLVLPFVLALLEEWIWPLETDP